MMTRQRAGAAAAEDIIGTLATPGLPCLAAVLGLVADAQQRRLQAVRVSADGLAA